MRDDADRPITRLLQEWQGGSAHALEKLIPLVYDELHKMASRRLSGERRHHTLQTTALVNEAYVKRAGQRSIDWKNRAQFFAIAAKLMRRILVDHARHAGRVKRGSGRLKEPLARETPDNPELLVKLAAMQLQMAELQGEPCGRSRPWLEKGLAGLRGVQGRVAEVVLTENALSADDVQRRLARCGP